jgi:hypothetical protein
LQTALLALFVFLVTLPAVRNRAINLDDSLYVGSKPVADGLTPVSVAFALTSVTRLYWHPLTWLSHDLDAELYGMNPALAIWQRKRRPWLLFGWFWFLVTLLPNAGLVQACWQSMADRFTHLPTCPSTTPRRTASRRQVKP